MTYEEKRTDITTRDSSKKLLPPELEGTNRTRIPRNKNTSIILSDPFRSQEHCRYGKRWAGTACLKQKIGGDSLPPAPCKRNWPPPDPSQYLPGPAAPHLLGYHPRPLSIFPSKPAPPALLYSIETDPHPALNSSPPPPPKVQGKAFGIYFATLPPFSYLYIYIYTYMFQFFELGTTAAFDLLKRHVPLSGIRRRVTFTRVMSYPK